MNEATAFATPKAIAQGAPAPDSSPVTPLGHANGHYYLLTGTGELRSVTERDLHSANIVYGLFAGGRTKSGEHVKEWLSTNFPPKRDRKTSKARRDVEAESFEWYHVEAGQWLMEACIEAGIFDEKTPVRHQGMWRRGSPQDPDAIAVVHCGTMMLDSEGRSRRAGATLDGAIYPTISGAGFPLAPRPAEAAAPVTDAEVMAFYERVRDGWGWRREIDPLVWFGWLAQAGLGAFPSWRAHLWLSGDYGSGKSSLAGIASDLLGPLSAGVMNDCSVAGVRQDNNRRSLALIFDEAEPDTGGGRIGAVIELLRGLSGDGGAAVVRGSADHTAVRFSLTCSAALYSILPGHLEPQDESRFVKIGLGRLPQGGDPGERADAFLSLQRDAAALGRRLWLRLLMRSRDYNRAFWMCRDYVQRLGGDARNGATIGAVMAGWHILTQDAPMDAAFLGDLRDVAETLLADAKAAADAGGGGVSSWDHLMEQRVSLGRGEVRTLADILARALRGAGDDVAWANRRMEQFGLRYVPPNAPRGAEHGVYLALRHAQLEVIYRPTKWSHGGHAAALRQMNVQDHGKVVRIDNRPRKVLSIPPHLWPEPAEAVADSLDYDDEGL